MAQRKPKNGKLPWRDSYYHRQFGLKASQEVERLLPAFEKERPADPRPRNAVEAIRAWAAGKRTLRMSEVRKLSLDCHAAARQAKSEAARWGARAAGHAIATWHAPAHALAAFGYAGRARVALVRKSGLRLPRTSGFSKGQLEEALRAIESTISKREKVRPKLIPGTSQHTLLKRRIDALHISSELIKRELKRGSADSG